MNMSYCKFENTARDLQACLEDINETGLNQYEEEGRIRLLQLCQSILMAYDYSNETGSQD